MRSLGGTPVRVISRYRIPLESSATCREKQIDHIPLSHAVHLLWVMFAMEIVFIHLTFGQLEIQHFSPLKDFYLYLHSSWGLWNFTQRAHHKGHALSKQEQKHIETALQIPYLTLG